MRPKLSLMAALVGLATLATPMTAAAKDKNHYFVAQSPVFGPVVVNKHDFRHGPKSTWVPAPKLYPAHDCDDDDLGWRRDRDQGDWDDDDDYGYRYDAAPVYGYGSGYGYGRSCWNARHIVNAYWHDRNTGHPAAAYDLFRNNQWAFHSGCGVGPAPKGYGYDGYGYRAPYGGGSVLAPLLGQFVR